MSADRVEFRFTKQPEIRGVSKNLILDLQDIVEKWGKVNTHMGQVQFRSNELPNGVSLTLTISSNPETSDLFVANGEMRIGKFATLESNRGMIAWDTTLAAADAKEAVRIINGHYQEQGLYDPKTGTRKPISQDVSLERPSDRMRKVSEMFANPTNVFVTKLDRPIDVILSEFDEPDKLEVDVQGDFVYVKPKQAEVARQIFQDPLGFTLGLDLLGLRAQGADELTITKANVIAMKVIVDRGLTIFDLDSLPDEERKNLEEEIKKSLDGFFGKK